jgi:oligoribonuclease NrnB/cAMP/cGMP phosphodiesterase (DHH superfamily)
MSDNIVVYHKGCMDGIAAAWAAWVVFPNWQYMPGQYQTAFDVEEFRGKTVYMVDFSYPLKQMKAILEVCERVVLLDHHKTCFDMLEQLGPHSKLDSSRCTNNNSGCIISWRYFHTEEPPQLLLHIEDRDLWKFNLNDTRAIIAAAFSYDYNNLVIFDSMIGKEELLCIEGQILLRDQSSRVAKAVAGAMERDGHWEANALPDITSELGNKLCSTPLSNGEMPTYAHIWFVAKDMLNHSLRSIGLFDVSKIASEKGGGGHRNAAGYREPM